MRKTFRDRRRKSSVWYINGHATRLHALLASETLNKVLSLIFSTSTKSVRWGSGAEARRSRHIWCSSSSGSSVIMVEKATMLAHTERRPV